MLIQGAASHIHLTAPHLVRDSLESLHPGLTELQQNFALIGQLNYLCGDLMLMQGRPNRWFGWSSKPRELIADHPVFSIHANGLAKAEARMLRRIGRQKRVRMIPILTPMFLTKKIKQLEAVEAPHHSRLEHLAKSITTDIFGIDRDRLEAKLSHEVGFGNLPKPDNFMTEVLHQSAVGYGGVLRDHDGWRVVARAWVFPLLVHELIKGTTELICLHGMADWDEYTYRKVTSIVDRLDHETLCMQVGPELWRRLLAVIPQGAKLAEVLMRVAKLQPNPLHELITQVISSPQAAQLELSKLIE